jgi:hypothetical protein
MNAEFGEIQKDLRIFWKENIKKFPSFKFAVTKILSFPATSVENERAFSKLSRIIGIGRIRPAQFASHNSPHTIRPRRIRPAQFAPGTIRPAQFAPRKNSPPTIKSA